MPSPAPPATAASTPKYRAFICYSQQDRIVAERVHRRLESYRVPKHLVGRETATGPAPSRLSPIFRDCDELAASSDIGAELKEAICASQFLIVLCSPAAAQSRWVNAEIEIFRTCGTENDRRILCAILSGDPGTSVPETECFPPALRQDTVDAAMPWHFPLAANFRSGTERHEDEELRLIAAMLDVNFDELKRREHVRRIRTLRRALIIALVLVLAFAALAAFAFLERGQAQRSAQHATRARSEAEKLVDFMIFDLRDKLESLGKLSLLEPANEKVRRYYETIAPEEENVELLRHRSFVLEQHGDDLVVKGDTRAADEYYRAAMAIRERLLNLKPKEDLLRTDLAGIHTKLSGIAHIQNNLTVALAEQTTATSIFEQLTQRDISNANCHFGLATALVGTASLHLQTGETNQAEKELRRAVEIFEQLVSVAPTPATVANCIAALNQLGQTLRKTGEKSEAEADLRRAISLGEKLLQKDPENAKLLEQFQFSHAVLSEVLGEAGRQDESLVQRREALKINRQLAALEPRNVEYQRGLASTCIMVGELLCQQNRYSDAEPYIREALSITEKLVAEHPGDKRCLADLPNHYNHLSGLYLGLGKPKEALQQTQRAVEIRRKICVGDPTNKEMKHWLGYDIHCAGVALLDLKRPTEAEKCFRESIAIANELVDVDPSNLVPLQFRALYELQFGAALRGQNRTDEARAAYRRCLQTVAQYTAKGGLAQSVHYPREEAEKALVALR
ncbi:MAG TPA: tetratricopeptide repeat protein [Chthoniobacterales bacterium]|nr:tetratricopeptide repeat protein [Chthoniobacterales bacterium]